MRPAARRVLAVISPFLTLGLAPAPSSGQGPPPKLVAETEAKSPAEEKAGFHLPEGFEIELVASEPMINKPMNLAFDDRGRLWVTSTVEYPYPVKDGKAPRDRVVVLSDFADDGHARSSHTFVDGLNIPIGIMPIGKGDSALVHDIPNIRRFVDTDGDGKADKIELAYEKYGFRDTHGMTNAFSWGFDGWIYACHGFSNESKVEGSDKKPIVMQSGNVYRMRPDGSHAEYYSHGQVNPFGLAFDPLGNLYSCDCHSKPIYQLIRGAYYPSFGKPDDGLGFGPEMIGHDHGSTGIGGIAYYAADQFPKEYQDTIFIGNVVTSRVNHDKLEMHGSSPKAIAQPDFIVSDDPWFRPVDIELGPDGALYIADFYNRIIGHYEVPLDHPGRDRERGRIWRVVYKGKDGKARPPKTPRPDESAATVAELVEDLGHPNLAVRTVATNQLVMRGKEAVGPVTAVVDLGSTWQKVHGLWVLHRLGALTGVLMDWSATDGEVPVRVHAMKILADRSSWTDSDRILARDGLKDASPVVRRASAEALGLHPTSDPTTNMADIEALIALVQGGDPADTHLKHVARIALRDRVAPSVLLLYALMFDGTEDQRPVDFPKAGLLADVLLGVPSADSARFLTYYLFVAHRDADPSRRPKLSDAETVRIVHHAARYGGAESETRVVRISRIHEMPVSRKIAWLKAIQKGVQERGNSPDPLTIGMANDTAKALLASTKPDEFKAGIDLVGSLKLTGAKETLLATIEKPEAPAPSRASAMAALVAVDPAGSLEPLAKALRDSSGPIEVREQAANLLNGLGKPEARALLVEALATAPARLQTAIATGLVQNRAGAEALLDAIAIGKASARPLQERGVSVRLDASGVPDVKARVESLLKDLPPADRQVMALMERRKAAFLGVQADRPRGVAVFEKNCAACHQLEGKGARIGPQLDGVGLRGVDRLLEDVLDPNRNVDQAFRVTTLSLNDGRVVSGLLLRQDGEILVLADSQGKEVRVPAGSVEEKKIAQLSPMPANMGEQIDEADFAQLMAYLLSQRPAK